MVGTTLSWGGVVDDLHPRFSGWCVKRRVAVLKTVVLDVLDVDSTGGTGFGL